MLVQVQSWGIVLILLVGSIEPGSQDKLVTMRQALDLTLVGVRTEAMNMFISAMNTDYNSVHVITT